MSLDRHFEIIDGKQGARYFVSPDDFSLVGSGGGADVYRVGGSQDVAFKIYRNPAQVDWTKTDYQIEHQLVLKRKARLATTQVDFSWPHGLIRLAGKSVGIVLPYVDRTKWISLDNWTEPRLLKKLSPDNASLSRRLAILRNLAKRVADLHARQIAVIDLRPSNALVHVGTGEVCLIDCDSFRIDAPNGLVFPGSHVSAGYICPEAMGKTLDIASLKKEQDLYAFAVIAFQMLNYGVHPFQGVLTNKSIDAGTDDEKARLGLYAYGLIPSMAIMPLPQSVHTCWPHDLRVIFSDAFASSKTRPSARKWHSIFNKILFHKMLQRCHSHPSDPRHIHFLDLNCGACRRAKQVSEIKSKAQAPASTRVVTPSPRIPIQPQQTKKSIWPAVVFGGIALLIVVGVMTNDPSSNHGTSQTADQQPTAPNRQTVQSVPNPVLPSFDCTKVLSGIEKLICDTPALAEADQKMALAYQSALAKTKGPKSLRSDQRAWITQRNNSTPDVERLLQEYTNRIAFLNSFQIAAPTGATVSPDVVSIAPPSQNGSNVVTPSQQLAEVTLEQGNLAFGEKRYGDAMAIYSQLADQGSAHAQYDVALMYVNGFGVPRDYVRAVEWYRKAADQGFASAQRDIGIMYSNGWGVRQDYAQAMQWARAAADQGVAHAQYDVGLMYLKGRGVPQDYAQAMEWYRKAAEQGFATGQNAIGIMYAEGWGVPQDYAQAMEWYRKAAEQGLAPAQYNIGFMYINGLGLPRDKSRALYWFNLAAAQGDQKAKQQLATLSGN